MKRKLLMSAVLVIVCLCTLAVFCSADVYGDYTYTLQNGEAIITGYTGTETSVIIPATLGGYPVVSIASGAFMNNDVIMMITISNGVETIGSEAFIGCDALISMNIPASVTSIGEDAFAFCSTLSTFTVDPNNTSYSTAGGALFNADKTVLLQYGIGKTGTSYTVPNTVVTISGNAFVGASKIKTIKIPASVKNMSKDAFELCPALTTITVDENNTVFASDNGVLFNKAKTTLLQYPTAKTGSAYEIPSTVTVIDDWAFGGCTKLTAVAIADTVDEIGYAAFANCAGLTEITIPGCATIGELAFGGCTALESVVMEEGVVSIGMAAFSGCTSLKNVTIPASVTAIGGMNLGTGKHVGAFGNCSAIESFTVNAGNAYFCAVDGSLFNKSATEIIKYATGKADVSYALPSGVTTIAAEAFAGAVSLESVALPESLKTINDDAFKGCTALTTINIPDGVTYVGLYAFAECTALTGATIPSTTGFIGAYSFSGCTALKTVKIYATTPVMGANIFSNTGSNLTICGEEGSSVEEYAVANEIAFKVTSYEPDVTVNILTAINVVVSAPSGGWTEGTNTFTVSADTPCVIMISYDGKTYTRLKATAQADGSYSFTADNVTDGVIIKITVFGDVNCDGNFSSADVTRLKAAFLKKATLTGSSLCMTDVNGDGNFSSADVTRLKAIFLKKAAPKW